MKVAEKICDELATTDHGLAVICKKPGMPDLKTIYRWMNAHEDFRQLYARAKELQADTISAQIVQISNTTEIGVKTKTDKDGNILEERGDMTEHRRLKIDARKWYASKLAPKKYGDKLEVEATVTTQTIADVLRERRKKLAEAPTA